MKLILTWVVFLMSTPCLSSFSSVQREVIKYFSPCAFRFIFSVSERRKSLSTYATTFIHFLKEKGLGTIMLHPVEKMYSYDQKPLTNMDTQKIEGIRFVPCEILLVFQDNFAIINWHYVTTIHPLMSYMLALFRYKEPVDVLFVTEWEIDIYGVYQAMGTSFSTKKFMVFSRLDCFVICTTCISQMVVKIWTVNNVSEQLSDLGWRRIHLKLLKPIYYKNPLFIELWADYQFSKCDFTENERFTRRKSLPKDHCLPRALKPIFNLTHRFMGYDTMVLTTGGGVTIQLFQPEKGHSNLIMLPEGKVEQLYSYAFIVHPYEHDLNSLIMPFESSVWLLCLITFITVALYFQREAIWFFLKVACKRGPRKCQQTTTEVSARSILAVCLEQEQSVQLRNKISYFIFTLWLFLAFIVGNAYKEYLSYSLSLVLTPIVPHSLCDLVTANMFLVTFGKLFGQEGSYLKHQIMAEMIRSEVANRTDASDYNKLASQLRNYENFQHGDFFRDILMQKDPKFDNKVVTMPDKYAFVDAIETIYDLENLFGMFGTGSMMIRSSEKLDLVTSRTYFAFSQSVFYALSRPYIQGLEQSGIFGRWDEFYEIWERNELIQFLLRDSKISDNEKFRKMKHWNTLAFLFNRITYSLTQPPQPISLAFMGLFLQIWSIGIVLCVVVWVVELRCYLNNIWKLLQRVKKIQVQRIYQKIKNI